MSTPSLAKAGLRRLGLIAARKDHAAARYLDDPPRGPFDEVLLRLFPSLDRLRFLQIGANDGVRADPIRDKVLRYGWSGLLVEPLPPMFAQLKKNYAGRAGLEFLNAAVDLAPGQRAIYFLRAGLAGVPDWAWGLASFDSERLRTAAGELGLSGDVIESGTVSTVTWGELLAAFGPAPCDVLVVDAEGYDLPLLQAAPFDRWLPRVIHFEHACAPAAARLAFYGRLFDLGYEIASHEGDTIAWRPAAAS